MRNLHPTFVLCSASQKKGEDFAKFCSLLRIYELYLFLYSSERKKMQFPNSRQCLCLPSYTAILCKQKTCFFLKFPSSSFSLLKKDFLFSSASVRCLSIKKGREQRSCQRAKNCLTFLRDFACVTSNSH